MAGDPFRPLFVLLGQSFKKPDHAGEIDLRTLKQQQSRQIGHSLLLQAELQREQLVHHPLAKHTPTWQTRMQQTRPMRPHGPGQAIVTDHPSTAAQPDSLDRVQ